MRKRPKHFENNVWGNFRFQQRPNSPKWDCHTQKITERFFHGSVLTLLLCAGPSRLERCATEFGQELLKNSPNLPLMGTTLVYILVWSYWKLTYILHSPNKLTKWSHQVFHRSRRTNLPRQWAKFEWSTTLSSETLLVFCYFHSKNSRINQRKISRWRVCKCKTIKIITRFWKLCSSSCTCDFSRNKESNWANRNSN